MTSATRFFGLDEDLAFIEIKYPPETDDPARVFRSMAKLIDAFHQIDLDLAHAVGAGFEPVLLLERVEAGSLRVWLRTVVRQLDDDALRTLDWRPLVGQYLVRGKHQVLRWLDGRNAIQSRGEVLELQSSLLEVRPPEDAEVLFIAPIAPARLLNDIKLLTEATAELRSTDAVRYVSVQADTELPTQLRLSSDDVERLLTDEVVESQSRTLLLIKKPDYLGNSRWEFRLDNRTIEARLLDEQWLLRFREGHIPLLPGDALDVELHSELLRSFEGNVVGTRYSVEFVHGVHRRSVGVQGLLHFEDAAEPA
jgi:hypothetical protein